jgi:hypothetical protein
VGRAPVGLAAGGHGVGLVAVVVIAQRLAVALLGTAALAVRGDVVDLALLRRHPASGVLAPNSAYEHMFVHLGSVGVVVP